MSAGRPEKLRSQQLQNGRKQGHLKDLSVYADWQVGFREMLVDGLGVTLRIQRMSTGAKHLHGDRPEYLSACKRLTRFRPSA